MTDSVNPTILKVETVFKNLIWDNVSEAALISFFASNPAWAVWPLQPILRSLFSLFANRLFDGLRLSVDLSAILIMNSVAKQEYDKSLVRLKIIAHDRGIDSEEFKKEKALAKIALAKFVSFNS